MNKKSQQKHPRKYSPILICIAIGALAGVLANNYVARDKSIPPSDVQGQETPLQKDLTPEISEPSAVQGQETPLQEDLTPEISEPSDVQGQETPLQEDLTPEISEPSDVQE